MRFLFRPHVGYATYLKKRCFNLALSITGEGILRRIVDGFLIQVTKRNGTAIADVIDLPGDIYVAGVQVKALEAPSCLAGYRLQSLPDEPYAGNMTWPLLTEKTPMYSSAFAVAWVGPQGYVSTSGKEWASSFGRARMLDLSGGGRYPTYTYISRQVPMEDEPFVDAHIVRIKPAPLNTTQVFDGTPLSDAPPLSAGAWRVLHVPLTACGVTADHMYGETATASFYDSNTGYLIYFGKRNDVINGGYNDTNPQIGVARIEVRDAEGDETNCVATASTLTVFTQDDILAKDAPQTYDWVHPGPFDGSYDFARINGDYNPYFPDSHFVHIERPEPGDGYSPYSFAMFEGLQKTSSQPAKYPAYWAEQPACVAHADGVDVLFTLVTERTVAMMSVTFTYGPYEVGTPYEITMDVPEEYSRYNHTATYLVRFGADGSKTPHAIYRSTYAVHDPELRHAKRAVYSPVLATLVRNGDSEQSLFACVRAASSPGYMDGGGISWWRGVAPQADDVTLELIHGDGRSVSADLGERYPVFYPAYGAVSTPTARDGHSYSKPDVRYGYGSYGARAPTADSLRPAPVCLYAPGMVAVIAAPKAGFLNSSQTATLLVVRTDDGSLVAEADFELPFVVEQLTETTYNLTQGSVTCVEQGDVDDQGRLTRYAKLLFSEVVKDNPSVLYRADDLTNLKLIGIWGAPGSRYVRGAAYYLGTPLAPAKVGRSTGRPFLKGKSVDAGG